MSNPNIHEISVTAGPTTNGFVDLGELSLVELQRKKEGFEEELRALGGVLESHGVDMNTRLLTPDGFPRADLDVAQIRTTRARIIRLKNDYKAMMEVIEKKVHEHFARQAENAQATSGFPTSLTNGIAQAEDNRPVEISIQGVRPGQTQVLEEPFAKVNSVVEGSPAHEAGLKAGDLLRNFGGVGKRDGMPRVGEVVAGSEGRPILVKVSRGIGSDARELELRLTPRRDWGGRGMLGCHILPL